MKIDALYDVNEYRGIKRIEIPKTSQDFLPINDYGLTAIKKYFTKILNCHLKNARKEVYLYNYYLGLQDILQKQRPYLKDFLNNAIVCENHALRQVDFKTGFITSENREYTAKEDIVESEDTKRDLTYLSRYFTDVNFFAKDKEVKEWIYITGVGVTDIRPRTDIIKQDKNGQFRFMNKFDGFNIDEEAPFEFNVVSPMENFVVYSSNKNKEPLFSVSMVETEVNPNSDEDTETEITYQIETKYAVILAKTDVNFKDPYNFTIITPKFTNNIIPLVEHCANSSRLGLIENNKSQYDCLNTIVSASTDAVVDNSNMILVFKNTDIDKNDIEDMKKAGAIILNDAPMGKQNSVADLDTLKISIDIDGFTKFYEQRLTQCYDIAGVPLASGQVTSGGDTGQARLLGGGWSNATTISTNDTNTMKVGDYKVLKQILNICKLYPDCPIDKISASQVDIKYKLNNSDNFLVKAQGIAQLYSINMPKDVILKMSGAVSDIGACSQAWEDYDKRVKDTLNQNQAIINGNNSQE